MTIYHVESHARPLVMMELLVPGGSAHDGQGHEGVASLVGWMFNEGGGSLNSEAFREQLDFYGISLSGNAGRDALTVSLSTLTAHLDRAWHLMFEALLRPRFDPADLERAIADRVATIKKEQESPDAVASHALMQAIYGDHPYGQRPLGSQESLANIRREELIAFHQQAFRLPDMVLAVAGDITLARLKEMVADFNQVDPRPSPFAPIPMAQPKYHPDQQHIELDVPQTAIRLGGVSIHRHDVDYYPTVVMSQILGGDGFSSRLTREIREKRGLTYGVYAYFSPLAGQGPFVIGMKTKTASVEESLTLIREALDRMATELVDDKELEDTKRYLIGSFPLKLDGLSKLASNWGIIGYYRRGVDYLQRWPERIQAVTAQDIRRVARRILDPNRLHTITVGRTAPVEQPLDWSEPPPDHDDD